MGTFKKTVKIVDTDALAIEDTVNRLTDGQNVEVKMSSENGEIFLQVSAEAEDESEAKKTVKPVVKELKAELGAKIYTTSEDETLEDCVVQLLCRNGLFVSCAESCTGGLLSGRIINVPGASEVIKTGLVTYSNKAKRKFLGVKKSTLEKYGAVSEQTAKEMAKGIVSLTKADVGLATTGIAGPDGGTDEKPVGLVYIGCSVCGNVKVREFRFPGDRMQVRQQTVTHALDMLRMSLLEYFTETKLK